jgi:hypothetical protein
VTEDDDIEARSRQVARRIHRFYRAEQRRLAAENAENERQRRRWRIGHVASDHAEVDALVQRIRELTQRMASQ